MPVLGPGSPFPRLDLRDSRGDAARPPEGEALYVFFKTTCPTCELLWPYLERLRRRVGGNLEIVAVSQDEPPETERFAREQKSQVRTVYDLPPWSASEEVGLENVPTMFLVGGDGRIRETVLGFQKAKLEELASKGSANGGHPLFRPDDRVPEIRPG
ncbi:MAG TPA: redoxin family protein [Thermoanaerobaculia bacterium]